MEDGGGDIRKLGNAYFSFLTIIASPPPPIPPDLERRCGPLRHTLLTANDLAGTVLIASRVLSFHPDNNPLKL